MKSFEEVSLFLKTPIPRSEIYKRPGGGGKELSYFETWWVVHLLNECFGNTGWSSEVASIEHISNAELPTYRAKVTIKAMVRGPSDDKGNPTYLTISHDGIGTCSGKDHEMSIKGAESDALKRAAVKFGNRLGNGLYDKSEEFIHDDQKATDKPAGVQPKIQEASSKPSTTPKVQPRQETQTGTSVAGPGPRDQINSLIRSTASVAFSKKSLVEGEPWTLPRMQEKYKQEYGVEQTENLSDDQANEVLLFLKGIIL